MALRALSSMLLLPSSQALILPCSAMTRYGVFRDRALCETDSEHVKGVMGGLLTLPSFLHHFPEIDTQNPPPGQTESQASNIQGEYRLHCRNGTVLTRSKELPSGPTHSGASLVLWRQFGLVTYSAGSEPSSSGPAS